MKSYPARTLRGLLPALVALASGCATITGSETQSLLLQAHDGAGAQVADAECRVSNDKGSWNAKPPSAITVLRSAQDLLVQCDAAGQTPGTVRAISRANAGMFGNIIFGGGVGALIDHSKGTAYDYPSLIRVVFGATLTIDRNNEPGDAPPLPSPPPLERKPEPGAPLARTAATAPAVPGLPAPGARYRYAWSDLQYSSRRQEFGVAIVGVDDERVLERFSAEGGSSTSVEVGRRAPTFVGRALAEGKTTIEFAPYLVSTERDGVPPTASGYPEGGQSRWSISVRVAGPEALTTAAGTFRAIRVDIEGSRHVEAIHSYGATARRFEMTQWYVPELKRYARLRHRAWNPFNAMIGDEQVELLEYRPD